MRLLRTSRSFPTKKSESRRSFAVLYPWPKSAAVAPEKRGTSTFLASETQPASEQAFDKPFKAPRYLINIPPQASADTIDHAAHHRFSDRDILAHFYVGVAIEKLLFLNINI